jgi:hypothetical protein
VWAGSLGGSVYESGRIGVIELMVTGVGVIVALFGPNGFELARGSTMMTTKRGLAIVLTGLSVLKVLTLNQPPLPFAYFRF